MNARSCGLVMAGSRRAKGLAVDLVEQHFEEVVLGGRVPTPDAVTRQLQILALQDAKRYGIEADLAACRADRQRLISENAAFLLRAVTAEEALARIKRRAPVPLKMNVLQTGSALSVCKGHVASELSVTEP